MTRFFLKTRIIILITVITETILNSLKYNFDRYDDDLMHAREISIERK